MFVQLPVSQYDHSFFFSSFSDGSTSTPYGHCIFFNEKTQHYNFLICSLDLFSIPIRCTLLEIYVSRAKCESVLLFSCLIFLSDVDECEEGTHGCHSNATCTNSIGSYQCACVDGFTGDGRECQGVCVCVKFFIDFDITGRRSGQSVAASDFESNGPRFESGRGRCLESLDKALYSHCPKEKPSH